MKTPAKTAFEIILIVSVVVAFAIAPMAAEAEETPGRGPVPFAEFDADGDGLVSEEEFNSTRAAHMAKMAEAGRPMKGAASAPAFADLDGNGDGMLNEEELAAGQKAHRKAMRGEGKGSSHKKMQHRHQHGDKGKDKDKGKDEAMKMPTFGDIDTDGDGSISPEEFAAHQAEHHGKKH